MMRSTIWDNFFASGGIGMFPIAVFGFLLLASAVLLALRPERRFVVLVVCLALMTLGSGVLATLAGIVTTFHSASRMLPARQIEIALMGAAEASHCMVFALIIFLAALAFGTIAAWRTSRTRA